MDGFKGFWLSLFKIRIFSGLPNQMKAGRSMQPGNLEDDNLESKNTKMPTTIYVAL
jgi:hypothetical protein